MQILEQYREKATEEVEQKLREAGILSTAILGIGFDLTPFAVGYEVTLANEVTDSQMSNLPKSYRGLGLVYRRMERDEYRKSEDRQRMVEQSRDNGILNGAIAYWNGQRGDIREKVFKILFTDDHDPFFTLEDCATILAPMEYFLGRDITLALIEKTQGDTASLSFLEVSE